MLDRIAENWGISDLSKKARHAKHSNVHHLGVVLVNGSAICLAGRCETDHRGALSYSLTHLHVL
jgi:hypothetical protein